MAEILGDESIEMQVESFSLVPSDGGKFEFKANDSMLYSKKQVGRHAEQGEVLNLLRKYLSENA